MKNHNLKEKLLVFLIPFAFLFLGILTLKDYGINWDEPFHFMRGQAYLHFFFTGEKNYNSLPSYPKLNPKCPPAIEEKYCNISPLGAWDVVKTGQKRGIYEDEIKTLFTTNTWRSSFQHDIYPFEEIVKVENGHPAIVDIFAAFFNYLFYQKSHLLGDIESHHLFEVFVSFLIVLGVSLITYSKFGVLPAVVAGFSLAAYPLFFSESHFNIKDPPVAAFFGLTIITFYIGITKNKARYIIASSVLAAFTLGTKFNAVFIAPIVGIWLLFYLAQLITQKGFKFINRRNIKKALPLIVSLILFPFITIAVFYVLWPYLWPDPIKNIEVIIGYYRQIGLGTPGELSKFLIQGWNTYPIVWIFYTTPVPVLFLSVIGFLSSLYLTVFRKNNFAFLVLVWFLVPILRVSIPKTSLYGGVRQIMEFLPAMAILAGIGVYSLFTFPKLVRKSATVRKIVAAAIFLSLLFVTYEMVRIHPNQNVYFNQLIGGLAGAKEKNIPYWGNTYGNVYLQGIKWLNENAEANAKLGLPIATMGNVPRIKLRSDIDFWNGNWSGPNRGGEYEMEMDFEWFLKYQYGFQYYDVYLNPVHVVEVDGVPLLKIWKNDLAHTKPEFREEVVYTPRNTKFRKNQTNTELFIDFGKTIYLTRITIQHLNSSCAPLKNGYIALSEDERIWKQEPDPINTPQVPVTATGWDEDTFVFLFAGKKARYLVLDPQVESPCLFENPKIEIRRLKRLP